MRGWTIQDALELYDVDAWGSSFFTINPQGNVEVRPRGEAGPGIDLAELVTYLRHRGLHLPLLIRFSDILATRIRDLCACFESAIDEHHYKGRHRAIYPIKVNQQRHVVQEVIDFGRRHGVGLEAGSKPELLAILPIADDPDALIICNGYKDRAYMEIALLAQKLGRTPIIVLDRFHELELALEVARELDIRPHLGVRVKLAARGAGRWVESGGDRSKFGLTADELIEAVDRLRARNMLDCLELLHFHVGSQITTIRAIREAVQEATRFYVGLVQMGAGLHYLDVGGGLGVDYDGSQTNFQSSMNYTNLEYARDIVATVMESCEEKGVPHPDIITETGRAMVAHHSVLIFNVLGVNELLPKTAPRPPGEDDHKAVHKLFDVYQSITRKNVIESYHDALQTKEEALTLFNLGFLDLKTRGQFERLFWACCERILRLAREMDYLPEELEGLERSMADTYYGNFSVFQSAPDHWAVKQLFPVMPIHRLGEKPTRRGVFADLTCDSDGKVDQFIDRHDVKHVLDLHPVNGEPYYIAIFLVGAYQEILGDLHNLFGDTDAVHVRLGDGDRLEIEHLVEGDSVEEVLGYVQFSKPELVERARRAIELALREGRITVEESARLRRRYEQGLSGYTYLEVGDAAEEVPVVRSQAANS
ncbi:MAG: biosynthetic arginine decarboxylase [Deltaproteobacteria bacterium]|nr:biosynthetic arginine decarboxylase [Deltaproteobacteria bacterium]